MPNLLRQKMKTIPPSNKFRNCYIGQAWVSYEVIKQTKHYQEVWYYFLSRDWVGSKWRPVERSSKINTAEWCKTIIDKTLGCSNVKYTPRVPLLLLTVEKNQMYKLRFVLLLSSLFFFLFPCTTQKLYGQYERSAHQTTALVSEIFLFLVRAACKLRLMSYGSKHASWSLSSFFP